MSKINHEEYKILKVLDDKWRWIARDEDGGLYKFQEKPKKTDSFRWNDRKQTWSGMSGDRFQFIQWEDEEPYNIQELIEEYEGEIKVQGTDILFKSLDEPQSPPIPDAENEKTEVKKDEGWLKEEVDNLQIYSNPEVRADRSDPYTRYVEGVNDTVSRVKELLDQLDEPEVLSSDWLDEKSFPIIHQAREKDVVPVKDLQEILVPTLSEMKKVQLSQKTADEINRYKEFGYSLKDLLIIASSKQAQEKLARAWLDGFTVEEEQKYYVDLNTAAYVAKWDGDGSVRLYTDSISGSDEYELHLTEQEIKDYDERFWPFRKPVEEVEE